MPQPVAKKIDAKKKEEEDPFAELLEEWHSYEDGTPKRTMMAVAEGSCNC